MSDHGMSIGEHDRTGKSNIQEDDGRFWPIYPEIGHVMLMLAGGAVPRGAKRPLITQTIDLFPSLCDLAGVSVDPPKPLTVFPSPEPCWRVDLPTVSTPSAAVTSRRRVKAFRAGHDALPRYGSLGLCPRRS